jgi:2-dehydro-3-deoxyphosphogluconate aldolase/(4S)-4-hydroxy-2-oxoglutarate aldolase
MSEIIDIIRKNGILPIASIENEIDAIPIGTALYNAGIRVIEVTFRTDKALESMRVITSAFPGMYIGAGTVRTTKEVDQAMEAGCRFVVSPGVNAKIIKYCKKNGILIIPGVATASEIEEALDLGIHLVKFFPCEAMGGIRTIEALSRPYPDMTFLPSGGITAENMMEYLENPNVIAVNGSWLIEDDFHERQNFDEIEERAKKAVKRMLGFRIDHIAVNLPKDDLAEHAAADFAELFDEEVTEDEQSFKAGEMFQAMKPSLRGLMGHMGVRTNSLERAEYYLSNRGVEFGLENHDSIEEDSIYLNLEIAGTAIQVLQKHNSQV